MGTQVRYSVRGRQGDKKYKVVNGVVKRLGEARGEDFHDSRHFAIFEGARAFQAWSMRPQGLVTDVHTEVIEE